MQVTKVIWVILGNGSVLGNASNGVMQVMTGNTGKLVNASDLAITR